ncbi:MAG: hypothetical protein ABSA11_12885 [Candidatus Bathyarchaeia archaeon]|jgi:hypothetical protein
MVNYVLNTIVGPIIGLSIILTPAIVGYKVLTKYRWVHIILTEILILFLMYFSGPWGPDFDGPPSWYYYLFVQSTSLNIKIGLILIGVAFLYSLVSLRKRWYESKVLLYYELIVFVEFIVLIPLTSRLVWGI